MTATKKALLIIFFTVFLISSISAQQNTDSLKYRNNPNYNLQMDMFEAYKTHKANVIMYGNSLTAGTNWSELLGRNDVIGRGIPSDVLTGFFARLNSIYKLKPKVVFLMGGLNDIYNWTNVDEIYFTYIRIIHALQVRKITPVIQSTLYAGKDWAKEWGGTPESNAGRNREVEKLNKMLSDYAKKNNIEYIDLVSKMSTNDKFMRPDFTWDGIHLNAKGYLIWAKEVEAVLQKLKL